MISNAYEREAVRWYVLTVPTCHRGSATKALAAELDRRVRDGEPTFEYFAPTYVQVRRVDGRMVRSDRPLLFNYVFIRASEAEILRAKRRVPLYSFLPRVRDGRREHYPYLSESAMRNLRWVARSYSDEVPVYVPEPGRLLRGDRVRITSGQFKGVEATVALSPGPGHKDVIVCVEDWMWVPLLHVREGEYEVVALGQGEKHLYTKLDNERLARGIHEAMGRHWRAKRAGTAAEVNRLDESGTEAADVKRLDGGRETPADKDMALAEEIIRQYGRLRMDTDVMKVKLYSLLLPAYTIVGDTQARDRLVGLMRGMMDTVKAAQAKASLAVALYGCTDSVVYHSAAHGMVDPWRSEEKLKKSKQQLIRRLDDYDLWLGHGVGRSE